MRTTELEALLETQPQGVDSLRPEPALPLLPGQIVHDKYEVERVLGVGGMGVVVSAMHLELGERVAIKAMLPEAAASRDTASRFSREAQAVARIKCEFVAHVLDVGKLEDGTPFMVMEHLEGETLAACLEREERLPIEVAVDTLLEACVALAEAHRLGIIHRDIKPTNLFLARDETGAETLKVLDFGIAKSDEHVGITRTSAPMGTPGYMSPEQLRSAGSVRAPADVWSLGVVLFEMLTGDLPFEVASFADFCATVLVSAPKSPRDLEPSIPAALEAVVLRCLQRDPKDRYGSVRELARALGPFGSAGGRSLVARIELTGDAPATLAGRAPSPPVRVAKAASVPRSTPGTLSSGRVGRTSAERSVDPADAKISNAAAPTPFAWRGPGDLGDAGFGAPLRRRSRLLVAAIGVLAVATGGWLVARPTAAEPAKASRTEASNPAPQSEVPVVPVSATPSSAAPVAPTSSSPAAVSASPTSRAMGSAPTRAPLPGRMPAAAPSRIAPAQTPPRFEDFGGRK